MLELLGRLLELPTNLDYLLSCGQLLPAFVSAARVALDHYNSLEADAPAMMTGGPAAARLSMLLQVRERSTAAGHKRCTTSGTHMHDDEQCNATQFCCEGGRIRASTTAMWVP